MKIRPHPDLFTERLTLRRFNLDDADDVQRMAGDRELAMNTLNMPYPYFDGLADQWIDSLYGEFVEGRAVVHAICLKETGTLIGAVGLTIQPKYKLSELGYWIGREHWNRGYCTEAIRAVIGFAFAELGIHKIFANHFNGNPASGKVMIKAGMEYEGTFKSHLFHWGEYKDLINYGIINPTHLTPLPNTTTQ